MFTLSRILALNISNNTCGFTLKKPKKPIYYFDDNVVLIIILTTMFFSHDNVVAT